MVFERFGRRWVGLLGAFTLGVVLLCLGTPADAVRLQHREVERLFQSELTGLPASERAEVLEAMSAAMSPLQWEFLRHSRGNSVSRARGVVKRSLTAILRDAGVDA